MLTAVISDLHLGKAAGHDLARRRSVRDRLVERVASADRLVLLGDTIELREAPIADALTAARPFFQELGGAFAGKRVTLACGNHDHQLARQWLTAHAADPDAPPLGAENVVPPPADGPLARIAEWLRPAELELAYPGVHLRDDVYATHGHYLDLHNTVPTIEVLAIGLAQRIARHGPPDRTPASPADYEAALGPVYDLAYALAQSSRNGGHLVGGGRSARMWLRVTGASGTPRARAEAAIARGGIRLAVAALNRAGLGPLSHELSAVELRRAGLRSMAAVAAALDVDDGHVVFGHTHRSGPWPQDDRAVWTLPRGGRLTNTGSWMHEPAFVGDSPAQSPYFPGVVVWVDDQGDPRLERVLDPDDVERALRT
jgi:hypothetical protein